MADLLHRMADRLGGEGIPDKDAGELFGAEGEDVIYRILREHFPVVIRGVVIPHNGKYLEKDFLVLHKGRSVVIEVKNWKGEIGVLPETGEFYQKKPNGIRKTLKSPVGTTEQFLQGMKCFYHMESSPVGVVIFADPDCRPVLPPSMKGILLSHAFHTVETVKQALRSAQPEQPPLSPHRILRCTRIYSQNSDFCKALLADSKISCYDDKGVPTLLSTEYLRYIGVEHQPLRLRDKLFVTFTNGSRGIFYNHNTVLSLCCLDGSCRQFALHKIRHVLF